METKESIIWLNLKKADAVKLEQLLEEIKTVWKKAQDIQEATPISPYDREFFSARYHIWDSINDMEALLDRVTIQD